MVGVRRKEDLQQGGPVSKARVARKDDIRILRLEDYAVCFLRQCFALIDRVLCCHTEAGETHGVLWRQSGRCLCDVHCVSVRVSVDVFASHRRLSRKKRRRRKGKSVGRTEQG